MWQACHCRRRRRGRFGPPPLADTTPLLEHALPACSTRRRGIRGPLLCACAGVRGAGASLRGASVGRPMQWADVDVRVRVGGRVTG